MQVRPCMLKFDGTVDYYLDPNDYTKKEDGTASDVADVNYGGNAMVEFPKSYCKIIDNGDDTANIYVCNQKLDDDYFCWSFLDSDGNEIDHCYMSIYPGCIIDSKLRSISGQQQYVEGKYSNIINYARNNKSGTYDWCTEVYCDVFLLQIYALLISKTTNSQEAFGYGFIASGGGTDSVNLISSGIANDKGIFYGKNFSSSNVKNLGYTKFFGVENYWSFIERFVAGLIIVGAGTTSNVKGKFFVKMTHSKVDGSTAEGYLEAYNLTNGGGYVGLNVYSFEKGMPAVITKMIFSKYGMLPGAVIKLTNSNADDYLENYGYRDSFTPPFYGKGAVKFGYYSQLVYSSAYTKKFAGIFSMSCDSDGYDTTASGNQRSCRLSCKPKKG